MPAPPPSASPLMHRISMLPSWLRLSLGLVPAALVYLTVPAAWRPLTRLMTAWDTFALATLAVTWAIIITAEVNHIRRVATRTDPGRVLSFVFALVAASASLLAVAFLLSSLHAASPVLRSLHVGLAVVGVMASWLLVHTLFTLRYAHLFYNTAAHRPEGGLEFPGNEKTPDYLDFAYFSFVIGMTAQTADVGISSQQLRRYALVHGLLSFGFNTVVVALTVGALAGLL